MIDEVISGTKRMKVELHKYDGVLEYTPDKTGKVINEMRNLEVRKFYGSLEIIFENGVIQRYKKTESIKL